MIPVVAGVLLALLINQWQQDQSEKQFVKKSLRAISNQNNINSEELEYALKRQTVLIDTLRKYVSDSSVNMITSIRKGGGLYTPDLRSSTWKFLLDNNNHTLVSYDYLNQLAEVEKYERLIDRYNAQLTQLFYDPRTYQDPFFKRILLSNLYEFRNVEGQLLDTFEKMDSIQFQLFPETVVKRDSAESISR